MGETTTYLDMTVGPFRLALRTRCVVIVNQDVSLTEPEVVFRGALVATVELRAERVPLIRFSTGDRRTLEPGDRVPFIVAVDGPTGPVALAADRVGYVHNLGTTRLAVPHFGMLSPDLFEGAVRAEEDLLLLLAPPALSRLAAQAPKRPGR